VVEAMTSTPWDTARRLRLCRQPPSCRMPCEVIDSGVNFFVRSLEELGAQPISSCDGHGRGHFFYVLFHASYELALSIRNAGFFSVEIEGPERFSLRITHDAAENQRNLNSLLRWASEAWCEQLGVSGVIQDPALECTPCVRRKRG